MTFRSEGTRTWKQAAEMTFLRRAAEDVRHPEGWRFSSYVQLGGDLWVDPELTGGTISHLTLASPSKIDVQLDITHLKASAALPFTLLETLYLPVV